MAKLRAIMGGNKIVALGEYADNISMPVPDTINFSNFDRMELINNQTPELPESWIELESTFQETEIIVP